MATALSLALKISADASAFKLDPVQRALVGLGDQIDKTLGQFDKFTMGSEAAAAAQDKFRDQFDRLTTLLRDGDIGATQFAVEWEKLTVAVEAEAKAFEQAAKITEASLTPLQKYQRVVAELKAQLDAGRISYETYASALDKAKTSLEKASESAVKTDKAVASLNSNLSLLTKIEIGRVIVDGFQAISGVLQSAVGSIQSLASSVNSSLDSLNDLSARTGINVEDFQGFSLAAKLAGVDAAAFGTAVQRLGVEIGKATPGADFDKSLKGIGLSVAELRALSPEQQFAAIGEAISKLPTAADRAAASVEIFGKQGAALAPLFREGAAGIDELRMEADKLGVIVSETQINNIAAMNDAFDKVSATVQGIVGQVIGNLAPAVTDVTNQFLEFVKNFNSGEGGKGIANAITDVLLKGAEQLAKVFDYAVEQFNSFSVPLTTASEVFAVVGQVFTAVGNTLMATVEGLRVVFNVFELAGNKLMIGLGDFLAGIGSWVSSDLEAAGKALGDAARRAADQNAKEMEQAAKNAAEYAQAAADATVNVFTGGAGSAETAGAGAAERYIQGMRDKFANSQLPEVKLETNADAIREKFDTLFNGLVDNSSQAAKAMQEFEQAMAAAQADGLLTTEEIAKIEELQVSVNAAIDEESRKRREATEAVNAQAEADQKRIESLLKPTEGANKLEEDIAAIYREQIRAQEQLMAARSAGSKDEADKAAAYVAQLDQVQAKLLDLQQAADQGFGDGFNKAFSETSKSLSDLIDKAGKFGNEGAKAAQQLTDGIARAQEQVRAGILSKDAYEAEVAAQRKVYEEKLAQLDRLAKAEQANRDAAFQAQVTANQRLDAYMKSLMGERAQQELKAAEDNFKRRKEAAENLKAIEDRIALQQKSVDAARAQNDLVAAKARQAELDALKKVKDQEKAIAEGKADANGQINRAANAAQQAQLQQQQVIASVARNQAQATQNAAQDVVNRTNAALEDSANRQRKLLNDLNTLGSRTVQTADVRTQEGAAIVLGLVANAQDPQLIEARIQNKFLRQIANTQVEYLKRVGLPVVIG